MVINLTYLASTLADPNRLVTLVKAHLWIERALNGVIESSFDHPEALNVERMQFASKVNLVEALGIVQPEKAAVVRRINTLRNKAAHRLDWQLDDDDADQLIVALLLDSHSVDGTLNERLTRALTFFIGYMEGCAQVAEYLRDNRTVIAAHKHLRAAYVEQGYSSDEANERARKLADPPPRPSPGDRIDRSDPEG